MNDENTPSRTHNLTADDMKKEAEERVDLITKEFRDGFDFIMNHSASVTFFGSARFKEDNKYYKQARSLASRIVTENGHAILTGGGPGIMEAANRGAFESGGESLGLTIKLPHEQESNKYTTDSIDFYYFFSRKVCLSFSAEAYIFFPGGYGTMDEFFEIITLIQTHKIKPVPIFLVGSEYWKPLDEFIHKTLLEIKAICPEDPDLYTITDDEDSIIDVVKNTPVINGVRLKNEN